MSMKEISITFNHEGAIVEGTFVSHITNRRCRVEKDGVIYDVRMVRTVSQTENLPEGFGYHLVIPDYNTHDRLRPVAPWPTEHGVRFDEEGCRTVERNYWTWDEINIENSDENH